MIIYKVKGQQTTSTSSSSFIPPSFLVRRVTGQIHQSHCPTNGYGYNPSSLKKEEWGTQNHEMPCTVDVDANLYWCLMLSSSLLLLVLMNWNATEKLIHLVTWSGHEIWWKLYFQLENIQEMFTFQSKFNVFSYSFLK